MTEPTDYDQVETELALPGLAAEQPGTGNNERAARRTLAALVKLSLVGEREAVMMEALMTTARQLDRASSSSRSKDYGVANLVRELRETYLALLPEQGEGGDGTDEWSLLVAELRRSGTAPRDPAEPSPTD
jgi:hypothetical protein